MDGVCAIKLIRGLMESNNPKYRLYTFDQLLEGIKELAENAASIIELSPENCKILLFHFKWDSTELTEKYFEASSLKSFLKKYNIKLISQEAFEEDMELLDECQVCEETKEVVPLACDHLVCFDCWRGIVKNLEYAQTRKPTLPYVTCNFEGCDAPVPETFTLQLFRDPETYNLYQQMVVSSYVESNPRIKWCPTRKTDCDMAVKATDEDFEEVTCTCGFTYCFNCEDLPHAPFPCVLIQKWKEEVDFYELYTNDSIDCTNCRMTLFNFAHEEWVICNRCEKAVYFEQDDKGGPPPIRFYDRKHPHMKKYLHHLTNLNFEFDRISKLENDKDNEFMLLVLKFVADCRQKFINFFAFIHFVEDQKNIFSINQKELEALFRRMERQIMFFASDTPERNATFTEADQTKMVNEILSPLARRLKAHLDNLWEESWKFKDETIQKAFDNA